MTDNTGLYASLLTPLCPVQQILYLAEIACAIRSTGPPLVASICDLWAQRLGQTNETQRCWSLSLQATCCTYL